MTESKEAAKTYCDNVRNATGRDSDPVNAFQAGAQWQKEQSPWISVKERLPEYTQFNAKRYVAKVEYGSMVKEYQTAVVWMQNKFKFNIEMDWVKVTHWMPIPE